MKAILLLLITLALCGCKSNILVQRYKFGCKEYREIENDSLRLNLIQYVCCTDLSRRGNSTDCTSCCILEISLNDSLIKEGMVLNLLVDTNIVVSKIDLRSGVGVGPKDEIIKGSIKILDIKNKSIKIKEDIIAQYYHSNKKKKLIGVRKFKKTKD